MARRIIQQIHKRSFWKISELSSNVYIKSVGERGAIFTHNNVACSLTKFMVNDMPNDAASNQILNSYNLSLDKYKPENTDYFIDMMNSGKPINITVESHILGNPMKGFTLNPHYLKKVSKC